MSPKRFYEAYPQTPEFLQWMESLDGLPLAALALSFARSNRKRFPTLGKGRSELLWGLINSIKDNLIK